MWWFRYSFLYYIFEGKRKYCIVGCSKQIQKKCFPLPSFVAKLDVTIWPNLYGRHKLRLHLERQPHLKDILRKYHHTPQCHFSEILFASSSHYHLQNKEANLMFGYMYRRAILKVIARIFLCPSNSHWLSSHF